uniref:Uncharacterized protein n=1 Tax=Anolis carolinensis TaxID=28377 RepID=R4G988_ANOCA
REASDPVRGPRPSPWAPETLSFPPDPCSFPSCLREFPKEFPKKQPCFVYSAQKGGRDGEDTTGFGFSHRLWGRSTHLWSPSPPLFPFRKGNRGVGVGFFFAFLHLRQRVEEGLFPRQPPRCVCVRVALHPEPRTGPVRSGPAFQNYGTLSHMPVDSTLEPLPPILADMDSPPGYEDIGIQYLAGKHFPLPPNLVSIQGDQPCLPQIDWKIPAISEDEAKEAFVEYVSSKCCYSKAPAMEMSLQDLQTFNTYRYRLETFTESRSTARKAEPYNGKGGGGCY